MENATKALLIAAAVLVVIVIIALGVRLLNSGSDVSDRAQTVSETTSASAFNAQFSGYIGKKKTSDTIRGLLATLRSVNGDDFSGDKVELDGDVSGYSDLEVGQTYKVEADYDATEGTINKITITKE